MKTQINNYGYCCINMDLSDIGIKTNRGMIKKTFLQKGKEYAGELFLYNIRDLIEILKWNHINGIKVYRMSSAICPWMSEYEISELPNYNKIKVMLASAGKLIKETGQRVSFHPGAFTIICSPNDSINEKGVKDLEQHGEIMDLMGLPKTQMSAINIHIGGTYGNKDETLARFCSNFEKLSDSVKSRLVVENDDKGSMYSVKDLYEGIYKKIGVPITFDFHHHRFCDGGLTEEQALRLASLTWEVTQLTHYSSCKKTHENKTVKAQAHADYIYEKINNYGLSFDVEIESKAKERAVLKYISTQHLLLDSYLPI